MATLFYLLRRAAAIALGVVLTAYSAWASWSHNHDVIGPLAAVSAALLLTFCEHAWRDRRYVSFGLLGLLGLAAAGISASIVLERVSHSQEARAHTARSANLPRQEAQKALATAQQELAKASAEASDACRSGRGPRCTATEQREDAARQRVAKARAELVGLRAETAEDPIGGVLGAHAETLRLASVLGLPLWLEISAPAVLAYGLSPGPRKGPEPKPKARLRKKTRAKAPKPAQDGVASWAQAYTQKHGRPPKVADARRELGLSKTTAWRRLRSSS